MMKNPKKDTPKASYKIALAGNPNVGKSTVFNALTGLNQHTGNWAGKTVGCSSGKYSYKEKIYELFDIPGCYSLTAETGEERTAAELLCREHFDAVAVVCDATCLERNLILALQTAEMQNNVVICVNLMDEAKHKGIEINLQRLSELTHLKCIAMTARSGKGLAELREALKLVCESEQVYHPPYTYSDSAEAALVSVDRSKESSFQDHSERYSVIRAIHELCRLYIDKKTEIENDKKADDAANCELSEIISNFPYPSRELSELIDRTKNSPEEVAEEIENAPILQAAYLKKECVSENTQNTYGKLEQKLDRVILGKYTALPLMLIMLCAILWLTAVGANYLSELLQKALFSLQNIMYDGMLSLGASETLSSILIMGIYRVLAWVTAVMLPPMLIFFPLFTLLEDFGYLPRVAFCLDPCFKKCHSCGKQALTMCMGLGCNSVGVTGCRIIDSPREKLIAIMTNTLVPCNGRFPTLTILATIFFASNGLLGSLTAAITLTLAIFFGISLTFAASKLLSLTLLKGTPSAFTLELPPYRPPQFGRVILRSITDRTMFVLSRALTVAAPAGLLIWLAANVTVGNITVLTHISEFLDPFAKAIGLDGVILLAFILALPANEIFLPIAIMAYTQSTVVTEIESSMLKSILSANGWTTETAVCTLIFCICHFPCATTISTIYKETHSFKYTLLSVLLPTVMGIFLCFAAHLLFCLF